MLKATDWHYAIKATEHLSTIELEQHIKIIEDFLKSGALAQAISIQKESATGIPLCRAKS